jgi:type III secretion protein L
MADESAGGAADLPQAPGVRIIRAADEQTWRDGFQFLSEVHRVLAAKRAQGYADGKAAGAKDASTLLAQTAADVDRYLASLEPELARLAFDIVRKVLGEFDDAELVTRATLTALGEFREARAVTIRVHPSAELHLRNSLFDLMSGAEDGTPVITVEVDSRLDERSCVLATDVAVVEASIETQLAAIAEAMQRPQAGGQL